MKKIISENKIYTFPADFRTNFRVEGRGMYTIIDALVYKNKVYALLESNKYGEEDMLVIKLPSVNKLKFICTREETSFSFYAIFIPEFDIVVESTYNNIVISLEDEGIVVDKDYMLFSDEEINNIQEVIYD